MKEKFLAASAIALGMSLGATPPAHAEGLDGGRQPPGMAELAVDSDLGAKLADFASSCKNRNSFALPGDEDAAIVARILPLMRSFFLVEDKEIEAIRAARFFNRDDYPQMGNTAVVNRFVILAEIYDLLAELKRDGLLNEMEIQYCRDNSFRNPGGIKEVLEKISELRNNLGEMVKAGVVSQDEEREFKSKGILSFELTVSLIERMRKWEFDILPDAIKRALRSTMGTLIEGGARLIEENRKE